MKKLSGGVICIGNGFNDIQMFDAVDLAIVVLGDEGMCAELLPHADVLVKTDADAFDLLLQPKRLQAALRR